MPLGNRTQARDTARCIAGELCGPRGHRVAHIHPLHGAKNRVTATENATW
jgi:hypothetical protein